MNDNVVEDYGWSSNEGPHSCGYIAPRILKILSEIAPSRVLDIGAGNGKLCSEISQSGYETVGVEYDQKGVEIAKSLYPNVNFYNYGVQDDPKKLLIDEELFDIVVSTEVIEHLFSPHLLPVYAKGVLKENGYIVITTPYHGYLKNLALSLFNKWDHHHTPLWHGGHIKFWSRNTLRQLLKENGFKEVSFSGVGRVPYLWKSMVMVAQKL
ncbi:class I SAM-dependent methyltransferase [Colwellia sp. MEBiC06753]